MVHMIWSIWYGSNLIHCAIHSSVEPWYKTHTVYQDSSTNKTSKWVFWMRQEGIPGLFIRAFSPCILRIGSNFEPFKVISISSENGHPCLRCSSTFDTLSELEAHCHSHTLNLKSFKCKFCERRFNLLHRLKEHEERTQIFWKFLGQDLRICADHG